MKKSSKEMNIPFYKNGGFYFILVYAVVTIGFVIQAFTVNILPMKYALPIALVLLLLLLAMYYLQMGKRVNSFNKILGKVMIVLLSVLLGVGNWYLFKTGSAFSRITDDNEKTDVMSIIVLKDSNVKELKDLKNSKFGNVSMGDSELQKKVLADIEKDVDQKISTVSYSSYKTFVADLYSKKVDAIILNEASRGLIEDEKSKFSSETRVIKEFEYKSSNKDISKNVNVTEKPFNVYITGIDTYGKIATVSRSDVNMVATINPKTHQILLTSIPRDYYIAQTCQDNQLDKLTHTGIFGVDCTVESAEKFFGSNINYYARVNFSSLVKIVDALGGITVDNPHAFSAGGFSFPVDAKLPLTGAQALAYSRERHSFADGDRERGRDQMRVITGIIQKAISPSIITNYTSILDAVSDSFQTNMSNSEMTSFIKMQLGDMSGWDIKQISVSGQGKTAWTPANGFNAYVMVPDKETVQNAIHLMNKVQSGEAITDADIKKQNELVAKAG